MSTAVSLPILGNIIRDTQRFIQNVGVQSQPSTCRSPVTPRIRLPDPPSLYPSLIIIGAEEKVAKGMDRVYNTRALELRSYYEKSISNAFAALAGFPFAHDSEKRILDIFASLYLAKVKSWIEDGLAVHKRSGKSVKWVVNDAGISNVPPFNADYVPLLEYLFDKNPFPTHADKAFLAKKSGMTYRQIHVWFQNRRNRTKKSNGTRGKRTTCEGPTLPFDLREHAGKYIVNNEQSSQLSLENLRSSHSIAQKSLREKRSSCCMILPAEDRNVLDRCTPPLHAFPSPYPPLVRGSEPFPLEPCGQMSPTFLWARHPNHDSSLQISKTDINDLVDRFALLSVTDIYFKRSQRNRGEKDSLAATHFITTMPSPAPHPALIRPMNIVTPLSCRSPFPIIRAPQLTSRAFISSTVPSTPIPPSPHPGNVIPSRRITSPLPKRYPRQSLLPCHTMLDVSSSIVSPYSSHSVHTNSC